jgi:hypothetical protein
VVLRRGGTGSTVLGQVVEDEPPPLSAVPRDDAEEQIIGYVEIEACEAIVRLEKVASTRVGRERFDIWDVEAESSRWWAIAGDTLAAYDQADWSSADAALSFHIGICARLSEDDREGHTAWQHWDRAVDAFADDRSAEQSRAVGAALTDSLAALELTGDGPLAAYVASTAAELTRAAAWLAAAEDARPDECRTLLDGVRHVLESAARLR